MNTSRDFLITSLLVGALLGISQVATAGNPYIDIPEQQRISREKWQHYWNSLSPRQQNLVKKIDEVENNYHATNGTHIPITQGTLDQVMNAVAAGENEAGFVLSRMRVYVDADSATIKADKFIEGIMKDPRIWK